MGNCGGILDVQIYFYNLLRQDIYCCDYSENTGANNDIKSNSYRKSSSFIRTPIITTRRNNESIENYIVIDNKNNERRSLKSDSSFIEPNYKESEFTNKQKN